MIRRKYLQKSKSKISNKMERKEQTGHVCRWMDFLHNDFHHRRRMYHINRSI